MSDKYAKRQRYDKLVRDKIPELLRDKNVAFSSHIAGESEYKQKLWAKLQEEVSEFATEPSAGELADILEVIYAIADYLGVDRRALESLRQQKAADRGGFKDRIILEES